MSKEPTVTQWGEVVLTEGALMRIQIHRPEAEIVLTPDAARELAGRLVKLAESMDGISYKTWFARRQQKLNGDLGI